ncbi:hypothetical protein N0V85_004547 [Neurospora sp. IMI 360204]|nr:hypothetical protein N0V85_004547 [Neurospora sp. IMI 360204]
MSYSPYFKDMCKRKLEGQPHYRKPTGLTEAQRRIADPPDEGRPAASVYACFDISQYSPDWEPRVLRILERPELGTEYVELDNGLWYLLEEDGGYKHMTDQEFQEFLAWKMDQEGVEEENTASEEGTEYEEKLLAEFDAAEEAPDSSLEDSN